MIAKTQKGCPMPRHERMKKKKWNNPLDFWIRGT